MEDLKNFETVIIIKKDYTDNDKNTIICDLTKMMKNCEIEDLGMKRLAYEIKGYREGVYIVFSYEQTLEEITKIEKYCRENDCIIKFLTVRKDD